MYVIVVSIVTGQHGAARHVRPLANSDLVYIVWSIQSSIRCTTRGFAQYLRVYRLRAEAAGAKQRTFFRHMVDCAASDNFPQAIYTFRYALRDIAVPYHIPCSLMIAEFYFQALALKNFSSHTFLAVQTSVRISFLTLHRYKI